MRAANSNISCSIVGVMPVVSIFVGQSSVCPGGTGCWVISLITGAKRAFSFSASAAFIISIFFA